MTHKQQPLIFLEAWIRVSQSNVLIDQLTWQSSYNRNQVANVCRNDYHHDKTRNVYPYTTFNKKLLLTNREYSENKITVQIYGS